MTARLDTKIATTLVLEQPGAYPRRSSNNAGPRRSLLLRAMSSTAGVAIDACHTPSGIAMAS
jgi:hypothetical protein